MTDKTTAHSNNYLPSLNGLRAVSIVMVIVSHVILSGTVSDSWKPLTLIFDGGLGVRIFFCISGFLITYLLLIEDSTTGISLKAFYFRRAIRIVPVNYAYIGVLFILTVTTNLTMSGCQFLTAMTYTKNYACGDAVDGHLWSLAVEEQFYLFWPFVVAYCRPATAVAIALLLCGLAPISRAAEYLVGHRAFFWLPSNADALMMGAMLAYYSSFHAGTLRKAMSQYSPSLRLASVLIMLAPTYLSSKLILAKLTVTVGPTLQAIGATYLIASVVFHHRGVLYKFLNIPIVAYVGVLSYSLYIWQELFLLGYPANSSWPFAFPTNIFLIFVVSVASYHLLEHPLLNLRRRLHCKHPVKAAG